MAGYRVNVRTLAEFAHEHGDLSPALAAAARMQEGARIHRLRQAGYEKGYEREVSLSRSVTIDGLPLTVYGRADGVCESANPPVVEEIKSTRMPPTALSPDEYPEHFAQAKLYGALLCDQRGVVSVLIRVVYVHPSGEERVFEETLTRAALEAHFFECVKPYAAWLLRQLEHGDEAKRSIAALSFPFDAYRAGQRELAGEAFYALRDRRALLAEAPTGIGKTMAVLFAAIKALGAGHTSKIFYLTARTTTRFAAEQALSTLRAQGLALRAITLTAKEKLCPRPGTPCDPAFCPGLCGYFDRRREALLRGMSLTALGRDAVLSIAESFSLCPFELQLDLSEIADVLIGDYNYVFDPRIQLKRYFTSKNDYAILVDEAHNLIDRARAMRSATVRLSDFVKLSALCPSEAFSRDVKRVLDALSGLMETYERPESGEEAPEALTEALDMFCDAARAYIGAGSTAQKCLTDRFFEAQQFLRVTEWMQNDHRVLYEREGEDFTVKLFCCRPGAYLRACYEKMGGVALFSATLSPMRYYADMLGVSEEAGDRMISLPSPFPAENLLVLRMPVATTYRRREETLGEVASAILALCRAKPGNYMACFPSHAYLQRVRAVLAEQAPEVRLLVQRNKMGESDREAFLARFRKNPSETMLALIVMGGVFSEGVDLLGDRLSGVAIVGTGLPQISFEGSVLARVLGGEYDEEGEGTRYAYVYPGFQRVLQAAGRVIRTETDRGVILLLDERYFSEGAEALLPPHWLVRDAKNPDVARARIKEFLG